MNLALALKIGGTVGVIGVGAMTISRIVPLFQKSDETADEVDANVLPDSSAEKDPEMIEEPVPQPDITLTEKDTATKLTPTENHKKDVTPDLNTQTENTGANVVNIRQNTNHTHSAEDKLNFDSDDHTYLYAISEELNIQTPITGINYSTSDFQCKFIKTDSQTSTVPTEPFDCTVSKVIDNPKKQHKVGWKISTEDATETHLSTKHNVFEIKTKASLGITLDLIQKLEIISKTKSSDNKSNTYAKLKTLFGMKSGSIIGKTNFYIGQIEGNKTIQPSGTPTSCNFDNWTTNKNKNCKFFNVFNLDASAPLAHYETQIFKASTKEETSLKNNEYYLMQTHGHDDDDEITTWSNKEEPISVLGTLFKHITPVIYDSNYEHIFVIHP